jgi:hypothetical protein
MRLFKREHDLFDDPMLGPDHNGTERCEVRVRYSAIVHGNAKESSHGKRLDIRRKFFEMAPKGLFSGVNAKHGLKPRILDPASRIGGVRRQGIERLGSILPFIGEMEDSPALEAVKLLHFTYQTSPLILAEVVELLGAPAEHLSQLKDEKSALFEA